MSILLELELQAVVNHSIWVLGIELESTIVWCSYSLDRFSSQHYYLHYLDQVQQSGRLNVWCSNTEHLNSLSGFKNGLMTLILVINKYLETLY